ncbi:hypothetical protein TWF696_005485 [Orbilia brochopaga]|uniref:Uncharacterized protein n=1 Tax=Orbilia brochopaga TaxID=3140254 RepID=A0AAV9V3L8_9PEZI
MSRRDWTGRAALQRGSKTPDTGRRDKKSKSEKREGARARSEEEAEISKDIYARVRMEVSIVVVELVVGAELSMDGVDVCLSVSGLSGDFDNSGIESTPS